MKKKQVIAIAAVLAVVLLTSTAVYAIGNFGLENPPANAPVETPINTAEAGEIEAVQTLTAAQVDISEFSVPLGTKAEQILRDTLTKKQMTEQEIERYNYTPDSIKQLTYEEARVKETEYKAIWDGYQTDFADKGWDERNELDPEGKRFDALDLYYEYKDYADSIATGMELAKTIHGILYEEMSAALYEANRDIMINAEAGYTSRFAVTKKALSEFYLLVLEDLETEFAAPEVDGNQLADELRLMEEYQHLQFRGNLEQISPELMAEYTQRYQSGERIGSILG